MSKIPFSFTDEVLMLIHGLSSVGSIRGEMLSEEIAMILQNKENSSANAISLESRSKGLAALAITIGFQLRRYLQTKYNLSESKCRVFNASKPISSSSQRERVNHHHMQQQQQSFSNRPETNIWTLVGFDDIEAFNSLGRIHKILVSELKYEEEGSMLPPQPRNMAISKTCITSNIKKRKRGGLTEEIVMSTIGRRIEKDFEEHGIFMGTVTSFDEKRKLFMVK